MKSDLVLMLVVAFLLGMFFKQMMGSVCSTVEGNSGVSANSGGSCFEGLNDVNWDDEALKNWLTFVPTRPNQPSPQRPSEITDFCNTKKYNDINCTLQWAMRLNNNDGPVPKDAENTSIGRDAGVISSNLTLAEDGCGPVN